MDAVILLHVVQVVELRWLVRFELLQLHHVDAVASLGETDVALDTLLAILVIAAGEIVCEPINLKV